MRFYLKRAKTDLVKQIGYVPTSDQRDKNLDKLESAISDVTG